MTLSKLFINGSVTVTISGLLAYPIHSVQAATKASWLSNPDSWSWLPEVLNQLFC